VTNETRPFWADPANATQVLTRPATPTRRQRLESRIIAIRDLYDHITEWHDTIIDWSPAAAAVATLIVLIVLFHR
jgi:hypothetical protein